MSKSIRSIIVGAALALVPLAGCGVGVQPLMPTPVLYTESGFRPLDHIPANEQWTPRRVYFAAPDIRIPRAAPQNQLTEHRWRFEPEPEEACYRDDASIATKRV